MLFSQDNKQTYKICILDLNDGFPNESMRCIREILQKYAEEHSLVFQTDVYEIRLKNEVPDLSYDIYISSGGPGSPLETEGMPWDDNWCKLVDSLKEWNDTKQSKKHVFFICHSFQVLCRHYKIGDITLRKSPSFGIFPVPLTTEGEEDPVLGKLPNPFYCVDFRKFQVIDPNMEILNRMGAKILALEKERPHVPYQRALMAIRFNDYFLGTQCHPEADDSGMLIWLTNEEKKTEVIEQHGIDKYNDMVDSLSDPDKIKLTQSVVLPSFLNHAIFQTELVG